MWHCRQGPPPAPTALGRGIKQFSVTLEVVPVGPAAAGRCAKSRDTAREIVPGVGKSGRPSAELMVRMYRTVPPKRKPIMGAVPEKNRGPAGNPPRTRSFPAASWRTKLFRASPETRRASRPRWGLRRWRRWTAGGPPVATISMRRGNVTPQWTAPILFVRQLETWSCRGPGCVRAPLLRQYRRPPKIANENSGVFLWALPAEPLREPSRRTRAPRPRNRKHVAWARGLSPLRPL